MSSKKMNHDKILDLAVSKAFTKEDMNAFLMNLRLYKNSNSKERSRISSKTFQDLNIHNNKIKITDVTDQYRKLLSRYKNGNLRNVLTPYWVSILYPPNQPSSQQTQIQQEQPQTTQSSQLQTDQQIQLNQPIQPQNSQSNLIQQSQIDKPFQFQAIQPTQQSLTQNYQTTQQNNNNNNENQSIDSSNDKEIEPNQIESQQNQENSQDLNLQNNQQQIQLMQQNQPIQTQQFQLNTTQNFYQQQLQEMQPIHFQLNQTNYQQHQNSQTAQSMDTMQQFQIQSNQNSEDKQKLDEEAKKMENENLNSEKILIQQNGQNQNESQQESQNSEEIKQKKKDKNSQIDSNQQDKDVQEIQNKSQNNENSKEKQNSDENESDDCPFKLLYKFPSPSMQRYQMTCNYQKMYQQLLNSQYQSMQQYQTMQNYQMMQQPQSVYSQQYQMVQQGQPQQQQSQQASQSTQSQQQQDQANSLYQVQQQQQNAQSVQQPQTMQTFQYNQPQAVQSQQIQTQLLQTMQPDQSQSVYTYPQQLQMMQQYGYQQQQLQSQQQPYSQQIIQQSNETEQQQAVTNSQSQQSPQFQQSYQTYQYQPYVSAQQYQYQPNSTMYQYNYQQPQQTMNLYQSTPQTENYYGQEMQQQPLQTVNLYQSTPQTENDLIQEVLLQPQQQQTVNLYQSTPQTENDLIQEVLLQPQQQQTVNLYQSTPQTENYLNQEVQQQQQKISQNPSKMQPNQVNQNNSSSPSATSANPIINVVDSDSSGLEASNSKSCEPSSLACSSPQYQEKYHPDDSDQLEFNNSPSLSTNHDQILYKEIKNYFKTLHNSPPSEENDNQIEINEDKIRYQNEIESKFLQIIKTFHSKLNKYSIRFIDKKVEVISPKMKSFPKTKITRECNTSILYNPNSKEFIDQHNEDHLLKSDIDITLYTKTTEIRNFNLNEKLITFFLGEFQDDSCCSYKIDNIEVSTVVSYKFTNSNEIDHMKGEFLFCQPAYVYFVQEEKKHVLNFFGIEVDTQFIFPAKAMIFHRESNINKLYIRGDIRVIEFTINGLDEYIQISFKNGFNHPVFWNNEFDPGGEIKRQMISIVETGTYFYEDFEYKKSVISVWNDELVLGINNLLVFWKIEGKKESSHQSKIEIENIQMITSLQIIDKKDLNSYLAVASEIYPVISILNKEHQIVSKLISHTLGVASLNSYGFRLFSGSFDNTVNVWNLNKSLPLSLFHIASNEITAIETGTFCDHLFLFMGTENHNVYCWSVTLKKILFEINLNENTIPKKIVFMSASNNENGDFCKLMVISEFEDPTIQNIFKTNEVQYFEFM